MKKYAWLILIYGVMPIHAADLSSTLCPNPIPQPFTTTEHHSTEIKSSNTDYTMITCKLLCICIGWNNIKFQWQGFYDFAWDRYFLYL